MLKFDGAKVHLLQAILHILYVHVQSKSPLWAHLMAYAESEGKEEFQSRKAAAVSRGPAEISPDRLRRPHFTSSLSSIAMTSTASSNTCKFLFHPLWACATCSLLLVLVVWLATPTPPLLFIMLSFVDYKTLDLIIIRWGRGRGHKAMKYYYHITPTGMI